jgi:Flp pilus assembly protein TadD
MQLLSLSGVAHGAVLSARPGRVRFRLAAAAGCSALAAIAASVVFTRALPARPATVPVRVASAAVRAVPLHPEAEMTSKRFTGRVGQNLTASLLAAGVPELQGRQYVGVLRRAIDLSHGLSVDDRFDLVLQRDSDGKLGQLLYIGLDRIARADVELLKWTDGKSMIWVNADGVGGEDSDSMHPQRCPQRGPGGAYAFCNARQRMACRSHWQCAPSPAAQHRPIRGVSRHCRQASRRAAWLQGGEGRERPEDHCPAWPRRGSPVGDFGTRMIAELLAAAAASTVAQAPPVDGHKILAGAEHAIQTNRLDQATVMISRAVQAGAAGPDLERVYADLDYSSGRYSEALARYDVLLKASPTDASAAEHAGLAALKLGQAERASSLLSQATSSSRGTWRAWNALGVIADLRSDWATAQEDFKRAARMAPRELAPINNLGWSLLLRGQWSKALVLFQQAIAIDPESQRTANNLELARSALAAELPQREPGETDESWAARLNDAGVAAATLGDRKRASAAFTQALDVSGTWYARAANNLAALGER